ncbi:unnamed protein product [marine sediment metagenome]|uniref:Uncharacterized protein n=1 Tax=marine sediment metagenome TaxID=412755 RepID=X0TJD1_9ZZZZ
METKIEKIGGKNKLTVYYKGQVFIVQCASEDVSYFKNNVDVMIKRFKDDLLGQKVETSESNAILPDVRKAKRSVNRSNNATAYNDGYIRGYDDAVSDIKIGG